MSDETRAAADRLAAADAALLEALRAGDVETALVCASTRNEVLGQIAERALAGVEAAREQLLGARARNDQFESAAALERDRVAHELDAAQSQRRLRERVRPALRNEPRFVSRRA
jgi:hypothetical protein